MNQESEADTKASPPALWSALPAKTRLLVLRWLGVFRRCVGEFCLATLLLLLTKETQIQYYRWYAAEFAPERVAERAALRLGDCHRCGACCGLTLRCRHLRRDAASGTTSCAVYGVCQPAQCGAFPLDRRDLRELPANVRCGYTFADARADPPLLRLPSRAGLARFARIAPRVIPQTIVSYLFSFVVCSSYLFGWIFVIWGEYKF